MPDNLPEITEEEQALQAELHKVQLYPKLGLWLKLFLDKSNKETYGNRTKSAIEAYSLDPITQYVSAGHIGYENYKKVQNLAAMYYEQEGMGATKVLDLIAAHAVAKGGKALEMLGAISGVYQPKALIAIQNNAIVNNNMQVTVDEEKEIKTEFAAFINQKYGKKTENVTEIHENTSNIPISTDNQQAGIVEIQ